MISRTQATLAAAFLSCVLALSGCAAEVPSSAGDPPSTPDQSSDPATPEETESVPVTQEESCDWDTARLDSGTADAPSAAGDDFETAIIGAWQHTHIDSGAGYEPVKPTTDIRYVFPSTTTMLYCQDVKGATSQAERKVTVSLDGVEIIVPAPATGYAAVAWDGDTMVWENHRDGSLYLLKRR